MLVLVTERWDPNGGGRERYAAELVAYLSGQGRHVSVICRSRLAGAGAPNAAPALGWLDSKGYVDAQVLALSPVTGATHYQLHAGVLASAFAAERESMRSAARRRLFPAGLALNRHRQRLLADEARLLASSTSLMVFSDAVARELTDRGVPAARVVVARPGVDLDRFRPLSGTVPQSHGEHREKRDLSVRSVSPWLRTNRGEATTAGMPLRLVFAGHNFALKGLHAAILSVAGLRRNGIDATLTVAGRGSVGPYARLASRADVEDRVRFAGALTQDAMADLYRSSDALVHPTFYDPFPRVAIEALACGCPVITTERCGAAEILTDGADGFVIRDPRDVKALTGALGALADRPRLARMRRAAAELGARFDAHGHFRLTSQWLGAK